MRARARLRRTPADSIASARRRVLQDAQDAPRNDACRRALQGTTSLLLSGDEAAVVAMQNGVITELRSRGSGRDSNAPTSGPWPGALPDNRPTPARSRLLVAVVVRGRCADSNRGDGVRRSRQVTEPLRPATSLVQQ